MSLSGTSGTSSVQNIVAILQDRYLETTKIKRNLFPLTTQPACASIYIQKRKQTTVGKVQLFMTFALFAEKQVNLGVSGVIETAGVK